MYGTTNQFLQVFGLRNLEELPRKETLESPNNYALVSDEQYHQVGQSQAESEIDDDDKEIGVSVITSTNTQPEISRDGINQKGKVIVPQLQSDAKEDLQDDDGDTDDDDYDDEFGDDDDDPEDPEDDEAATPAAGVSP